jgi:hypothetical protein
MPKRPRCRWEDNTKMEINIRWSGMTGFIWLRIKPVEGSCEHSNELSGSNKYWEFLSG